MQKEKENEKEYVAPVFQLIKLDEENSVFYADSFTLPSVTTTSGSW